MLDGGKRNKEQTNQLFLAINISCLTLIEKKENYSSRLVGSKYTILLGEVLAQRRAGVVLTL